jgi:hypothetical protein
MYSIIFRHVHLSHSFLSIEPIVKVRFPPPQHLPHSRLSLTSLRTVDLYHDHHFEFYDALSERNAVPSAMSPVTAS